MNRDLSDMFFKDDNPITTLKPIIFAHRGASGYEPENTLRAFKRALEMGLHAIELDVFLSKSNDIVVIHDETINRTTNGQGYVNEIPWEILKKYNAGKGEHIPLLSEVLDLIEKISQNQVFHNFMIDIELKGPFTAKPVAELISYYIDHRKWATNNFIVSSFDHTAIQEFKYYLPTIKTGAIFFQSNADLIKITQQSNAEFIILDYQSITSNLITQAHAQGLFVFVYTVNDPAIAQELSTWHIDGIITDYPDILNDSKYNPNILH